MKKIFIVIVALLIIPLFGCSRDNDESIFYNIGLNKVENENIKLITKKERKSSFNGDGEDFYAYEIKNSNKIIKQIKEKKDWKKLPLSENISNIVYGNNGYSPFIIDKEGNKLIPYIKNGYYYFYNTSEDAKDKTADTYLKNSYSYNFIIAIFDTDTNMLYYAKLDT